MTPTRTHWILLIAVTLIVIVSVFFSSFLLNAGIVPPIIHTPYGFVIIQSAIPDSPREIPIYRGILREGDILDLYVEKTNNSEQRVVSIEEALSLARLVIVEYGGLPSDAEPWGPHIQYGEKFNSDTGEIIEKIPVRTSMGYYRRINGLPIEGYSDRIYIDFGINGEKWFFKRWRTLEYTGTNTAIISPQAALVKMSRGEILDPPKCCLNVFFVKNISPGYFEKYPLLNVEDPVIEFEPVWVLTGILPDGDSWSVSIPARV